MTHDILFRGKRTDNGEWVTGYLTKQRHSPKDPNYKPPYELQFVIDHEEKGVMFTSFIDPETIGQYTGMSDKNDTPIYAGDIIRLITANYEQITIICEFGTVHRQIYENEVEITGFYFVRSNDGRKTFPITRNYLNKHDTELWEVVGNIYDNGKGGSGNASSNV